jgi:hypothetical protein
VTTRSTLSGGGRRAGPSNGPFASFWDERLRATTTIIDEQYLGHPQRINSDPSTRVSMLWLMIDATVTRAESQIARIDPPVAALNGLQTPQRPINSRKV